MFLLEAAYLKAALDAKNLPYVGAELAQPLFGIKRGRRSFTRPTAMIHRPA